LYVLIALIGLAGVLATRETWGPKQKADVDAILNGSAPGQDAPAAEVTRAR
ncbi:MAG: hypothetical protein QOH40_485, partial [Arthrobacter pascens]|nr:hypothetical protein [Arthrobacter pascens]